jgi:hypothetical protein
MKYKTMMMMQMKKLVPHMAALPSVSPFPIDLAACGAQTEFDVTVQGNRTSNPNLAQF